jgi:peptidoglycan-N-acetylglucosamine deacetylase
MRLSRIAVAAAVGCRLVLGGVVLTGAFCAAGPSVELNGHRVYIHSSHLTVGQLLALAHVTVGPGVVLTGVTRRPIPGHTAPPVFSVDGKAVGVSARVAPGDHVIARPGTLTEPVVTRVFPVGFAGLPSIEFHLWHPGRRATERERVGRYSGHVVSGPVPNSPALAATPVTGKEVALTFDGGPSPRWTPEILRVLRAEGVHATFCIGSIAAADPGLVRTEAADGETLCDHTMTHDEYLPTASHARIVWEIDACAAEITRDSGGIRPAFYRPPGGFLTSQIIKVANAAGMQVLYWDIDTVDWQDPPARTIAARALQAGPGDIILMHDGAGNPANVVALPTIINTLRQRGYRFVTPASVAPAPAPLGTPLPKTPIPPAIEKGPAR